MSEYDRQYYLKNKLRLNLYYKDKRLNDPAWKEAKRQSFFKSRDEIKNSIFSILGKRCRRCGFDDERALQIDHIYEDGRNEKNKSSYTHYRKVLISLQKEEGRFQILCSNCNWIKRVENKEYMQRKPNDNKIYGAGKKTANSNL